MEQKIDLSFTLRSKKTSPKKQREEDEEEEKVPQDHKAEPMEEEEEKDKPLYHVEVTTKMKAKKLKELIAVQVGMSESDRNNVRLFVNGEEITDESILLKDLGVGQGP